MTDGFPVGSHATRAIVCATLTLFTACGDSTAPAAGSGFYRLTTVNSLPLPWICPASTRVSSCTINGGELLLRRDGTFALAIDGFGFLNEGTYVRGRDSLTYTVPNGDPTLPPTIFSTAFAGDSISLAISQPTATIVFRSSGMPSASIASAAYTLTEANGRVGQPVVLGDTVIDGTRYVYRVEFDSLWLFDAVFFKQHRKESSFLYTPRGDTLRGHEERRSYGTFSSDQSWVVLRRYYEPSPILPRTDSLAIDNASLTRATRLINNGRRVERYSRIR